MHPYVFSHLTAARHRELVAEAEAHRRLAGVRRGSPWRVRWRASEHRRSRQLGVPVACPCG
jgi:hypothetical protein